MSIFYYRNTPKYTCFFLSPCLPCLPCFPTSQNRIAPNQLSFYAWVILFRGYQAGAFYPTQHFEYVINSLVNVIESHGGQVLLNHEVTNFRVTDRTVTGVQAMDLATHQTDEFTVLTRGVDC